MLGRYSHVLFDLDGTIFNTEYAYTSALYDVLKAERPDTEETYESLTRFMGSTAENTRIELNLPFEDTKRLSDAWIERVKLYEDSIKPFDGIMAVIRYLHEHGIKLGIVTSRAKTYENVLGEIASPLPSVLKPYFTYSISASDVENPKPAPDSILKYMEITGAKREEILFIGDTLSDIECAHSAGVDFGLAVWGSRIKRSIMCAHYFMNPWDIIKVIFTHDDMNYQWYRWAKEIQAIGQIGLTYCTNVFDIERFERLREISCEIISTMTETPFEKVKDVICMDKGYITPKIDTRAAVFNEKGQILLVKESKNGLWSLPGGWCDEAESIISNTVKEVREEAGMLVKPVKFVGMIDKSKWNKSSQPFHILASFTVCLEGEGEFTPNSETLERRFFSVEEVSDEMLRLGTTTTEQIRMCSEAFNSKNWVPVID